MSERAKVNNEAFIAAFRDRCLARGMDEDAAKGLFVFANMIVQLAGDVLNDITQADFRRENTRIEGIRFAIEMTMEFSTFYAREAAQAAMDGESAGYAVPLMIPNKFLNVGHPLALIIAVARASKDPSAFIEKVGDVKIAEVEDSKIGPPTGGTSGN